MNYTISFDVNAPEGTSATGTMKPVTVTAGTKLKTASYKIAGKKFVGWNTKADGSGKTYKTGDEFYMDSKLKTYGNSITLYAMWE